MKVIFCGRKHWASLALKYIIKLGWEVQGVMPAPEPTWMPEPHLLAMADKLNLPIIPPHLPLPRDTDIVISYLYPYLIKEPLLSHAKLGAINFHPGLLPEFAGLRGYNYAILEGHQVYGCTAHFMNEKFDSGDIIKSSAFPIDADETAFSLEYKTQQNMLALFKNICKAVNRDEPLPRFPQPSPPHTVSRAEFEKAKWSPCSYPVERWVRAWWYPPYRGATISIDGEKLTLVSDSILKSIAPRLHLESLR